MVALTVSRSDSDFFLPYGYLAQKKELPEDLETAVAEFGLVCVSL